MEQIYIVKVFMTLKILTVILNLMFYICYLKNSCITFLYTKIFKKNSNI